MMVKVVMEATYITGFYNLYNYYHLHHFILIYIVNGNFCFLYR